MSDEVAFWTIRFTDGFIVWWSRESEAERWTPVEIAAKRFTSQKAAEEVLAGLMLETGRLRPGKLDLVCSEPMLIWHNQTVSSYQTS